MFLDGLQQLSCEEYNWEDWGVFLTIFDQIIFIIHEV